MDGEEIKKLLKKGIKRISRPIIISLMIGVLVVCLFWGVIDGIFKNASKIFNDVAEHVNIVGNNLEIDQEYLTEAKKRLKNMGVNPNSLGLEGREDYLERFLEAEIVTSYPNLGGDGLQGAVYFERYKIDGSTQTLNYIDKNTFYSKKNNGESDIYNYFTLDQEDWTVHVATNDGIEKIDYKNMVSKYAMPFEFPITLATVTQNPQFVLAVVKLVKKSRIVIAIAESKTTTTTTNTVKYDERVETIAKDENGSIISSSSGSNVAKQGESKVGVEETYSTDIYLARANTWILNEVTDMQYDDTTENDEPIITNLPSKTNEQRFTEGTVQYTYITHMTNMTNTKEVERHHQRWKRGTSKVIDRAKNFTNLILRDGSTIDGGGIVAIAKECHDYLCNNEYWYPSQANLNAGGYVSDGVSVTHKFPEEGEATSKRYVDCSGYASWVLSKAGYDIQCISASAIGEYGKSLGWEEIHNVAEVQAGDFVIWNNGGHVNICVGENESGKKIYYDCGNTNAIRTLEPIVYGTSGFYYAVRPNDEIAQALNPETTEDLKKQINDYIKAIEYAKFSVNVEDLKSNKQLSINNSKIPSEGWLKIFIMATAYDEIKQGNINEEEINSEIDRMITADDSNATNLILKKLGQEDIQEGIDIVNKYLNKYGYNSTKLTNELSEDPYPEINQENYTSVSDVAKIFKKIFENKCVNKEYSEKMINWLNNQIHIDKIPSQIQQGNVYNKTGTQIGIRQDAAIVSIENANYTIVISATEVSNVEATENDIRAIAKLVNDYFVKNGKIVNNNHYQKDDEIETIMNGRRVCYKLHRGNYQCPLDNLVEGREMIFELLGSTEKTQSHEKLMRYLLHLLTGRNFGVTEFDFNEFLNGSFTGAGGAWTAIWGNGCTKEEFIAAVKAYKVPNVIGNGGRSAITCYNKYFLANAENFYDICTKNGMDPRFIFCIGIHESYFGTSNIANKKGNFFGWGAYDWDPGGSAITFADMSEGIEDVSAGLRKYVTPGTWQYERIQSNGYDPTTIDGIGSLYATDPNWATAVKQHMTNIFGMTGEPGAIGDGNLTEMQNKIREIAASQNTLGNRAGYCQAWVADVYAKAGQTRTSSCCASTAADKWVISQDKNNIPIGACVYGHSYKYIAKCGGREAGHVGIYIGNGQVASNVGGIKIESLEAWTSTYGWKGWGWNGGTDYSK